MIFATNKQAADVLFNVATILEHSGDNPYRIRAYRRAARCLLSGEEINDKVFGPALRKKLAELHAAEHNQR